MTRRVVIAASIILLLLAALCIAAAVATEGAIHPPRQIISGNCPPADHTRCRDASVTAPDGVILRAWYFEPEMRNGASILLLHGIGASRLDMVGLGLLFERAGYTVLIPDLRGHGASGGLVTYGVVEEKDISSWADWMLRQNGVTKLFAFGASLGGSELLESLNHETRFRGVIAESAYSDFRSIANERIARLLPKGTKWISVPFVEAGILWADWRYSIQLNDASAIHAIRNTRVPIFLIHGADDNLTSPLNSVALEKANPSVATLWICAGRPACERLGGDRQRIRNTRSWLVIGALSLYARPHNRVMSRGWESKSVESQMEEAASRRDAAREVPLSPDQIRLRSERQSLELSRTRILKDLETTSHPRRKEQLLAALQHLEQKISALGL